MLLLHKGASLKLDCVASAFAISKALGLQKPNIDKTTYICNDALKNSLSLQSKLKERGTLSKVLWSLESSLLTTGHCIAQTSSHHINGTFGRNYANTITIDEMILYVFVCLCVF